MPNFLPTLAAQAGRGAIMVALAALASASFAQTPATAAGQTAPARVGRFKGKVAPVTVEKDEGLSAVIAVVGNVLGKDGRLAEDQLKQSFKDMAQLPASPNLVVALGGMAPGGEGLAERLGGFGEFKKRSGLSYDFAATVGTEAQGQAGPDKTALGTWRDWATKNARFPEDAPEGPANYTTKISSTQLIFLDTVTPKAFGALGRIDAVWLQDKLREAMRDPKTTGVVVFGSDPLIAPQIADGLSEADLAWTSSPEAAAVRNMMVNNPKFVGYVCGRPGQFSLTPLVEGRRMFQIATGIAGGPLDPSWQPRPEPFHGFVALVVYTSGRVEMAPFFRPSSAEGAPQPAKAGRGMNLYTPPPIAK